ncbi:MAG: hypothetical protein QOI93_5216 [Rhodospirillaceae bacterium]|nr:hypothetical protein [Rhodospirillaceae bacterium]
MSVALDLRDLWIDLIVDPSDARFSEQAVSLPTPESSAPSVVGHHVWLFPWEVVAGVADHKRRIDFDVHCGDGRLTDAKYAGFLLFCKLFALLLMAKPRKGFVDLSTIRGYLQTAFRLVDAIANTSFKEGRTKLAEQTIGDLQAFVENITKKWRADSATFANLSIVLSHIVHYGEKRLLPDWPRQLGPAQIRQLCKDVKRTPHKPDSSEKKTAPMPAMYCARSLVIGDFYLDVLADPIIERAAVAAEYRRQQAQLGERAFYLPAGDPRRTDVRYAAWCRENSWPVASLPFPVRDTFLDDTLDGLYLALVGLQSSAMQTLAQTLALRSSEFLVMERSALGPSRTDPDGGRITTLRFKSAPDLHSQPIEWDVPDWVRRCIEVQLRLGDALRAPAVWHSLLPRHWGQRLKTMPEINLKIFAHQHFLDTAEGSSTSVTLQRFRPTIAREILVSPLGHVRLLQRLLGHKDIQTTLTYIKMNPYLPSDLKAARYRRIGENPPDASGIRLEIHGVEGDIPADALGELIVATERGGSSLRLLAPGIIVPMSDDAGGIVSYAFGSEAVLLDALCFALRNLCRREIRASRTVHDWYMGEAVRLCRALAGAPGFEPADIREAAVLDIVRRQT